MAINVEQSIVINRPVKDVWAWIVDISNEPQWQGGVLSVKDVQPTAVGSTWVEVRRVMGKEMESTVQITELDAPNHMGFKVLNGPVQFEGHFNIEAVDAGTRLTLHLNGEPGGFFAVAAPLLQSSVKKDTEKDFATLKSMMESA